jgi:hypothetical protein
MVLTVPENMQLLLGGSAGSTAELPQHAFALTLRDDVLEDMIQSVRNGQEIQLSLGDAPVSLVLICRPMPAIVGGLWYCRLAVRSRRGEETVTDNPSPPRLILQEAGQYRSRTIEGLTPIAVAVVGPAYCPPPAPLFLQSGLLEMLIF